MTTWRTEQVLYTPHLMCDKCGLTEDGNLSNSEACEEGLLLFFQGLGWHRYKREGEFVDLCENCAYEAELEDELENYERVY